MFDLSGLPDRFSGPSAWVGSDLSTRRDLWQIDLSAEEIADLEKAATSYLSRGQDIGEITAAAFPLSVFSARIDRIRQTLLSGVGVEVVRGLPVDGYSQEVAATIFCGIGAHLGSARSQNAAGHILGHVRDTGANPMDTNTRIYQTSARQTFHTDSADVVGLLCLREAMDGGDSLLVSAEAI